MLVNPRAILLVSPVALLASVVAIVATVGACSSSSSVTQMSTDAGGDTGKSRHDAGKPKSHDSGSHQDVEGVCSPNYVPYDAGVDAPPAHDGGEGGVGEGGATDAHVKTDAHVGDASGDAATDAPEGGGVDAMPPTCEQLCQQQNGGAYAKFLQYQLTNCGCIADGPCYSDCHAAKTLDGGAPCPSCLQSQTAEGLSSTCTLAAAGQCENDPKCTAYQACVGVCPN